MATLIDSLKQTKTANTSPSSINVENQTVKDKPSFFDSLLSRNQITQNLESSQIVSTKSIDGNTKNINIDTNIKTINIDGQVEKSVDAEVKEEKEISSVETKDIKEEETKKDIKNIDRVIVKEEKVVSTSSLLDRLVLEAKQEVKTISEENAKSLESRINQTINQRVNSNESEVLNTNKIVNTKDINTNIDENLEVGTIDNLRLNIDEVIIAIDKNLNTDNNEKEISNTNKIDISNTISVPLSDNLNLQEKTVLSNTIEPKVLMNQLIQENTENIKTVSPEKIDMMQRESASKDFISNMYLSSQKNSINTQNLFNKNEAVNLLKDATSINDVKTSAQMLDLGLEDVSVDQEIETQKLVDITKKVDIDLLAKRNILDNLMLERNIKNEDVKSLITKSVEASSALLDNTLELADDALVTVNSPLSYNIQSKIIGAKQQMSTMMSDIAKQMYENYKPPVTVFKINLNPLELGSIAIMMKSDKNNSLSISMNISNNNTLDALIDNQNVLRNSLVKTFDEDTKFNLDFSSSSQNNNQSNNQSNKDNQNNQNRFEQIDTQSVLKLKEENKDREEKSIDYM
jgi:hypothetical protein